MRVFQKVFLTIFLIYAASTHPTAIPTAALSGNNLSVATYLNAVAPYPVSCEVGSLSGADLINALEEISPARYALLIYAADNLSLSLMQRIASHEAEARRRNQSKKEALIALDASKDLFLENLIAKTKTNQSDLPHGSSKQITKKEYRFDFWGDEFGEIQFQRSQKQVPAFHALGGGLSLGFDAFGFEGGAVGLVGTLARMTLRDVEGVGSGSFNSYSLALHWSNYIHQAYLEFVALGAFNQFLGRRSVSLPGITKASLSETFQDMELVSHFAFGYDFAWNETFLEPYLSFDLVNNWLFHLKENGDPLLAMKIDFSNSSLLRSELGIHAYQTTIKEDFFVVVREGIGYVNRRFFKVGHVKASFLAIPEGPDLIVTSLTEPRNLAAFDFQFLWGGKKCFGSINYQGEFGSQLILNEAHLELGIYF